MGDENSSEDEELRLIVWYEQNGLTIIRAVLWIGLDGWEVNVDLVMVEVVFWMLKIKDYDGDGVIWGCAKMVEFIEWK